MNYSLKSYSPQDQDSVSCGANKVEVYIRQADNKTNEGLIDQLVLLSTSSYGWDFTYIDGSGWIIRVNVADANICTLATNGTQIYGYYSTSFITPSWDLFDDKGNRLSGLYRGLTIYLNVPNTNLWVLNYTEDVFGLFANASNPMVVPVDGNPWDLAESCNYRFILG